MGIQFNVNGKAVDVKAEDDTPLLWVIRDEIGLTGTKFGCGMALCGACTVHLDGAPVRSCQTPLSAVSGKNVVTIESMASNPVGKKLQAAWIAHDVPQCGYCQSGQIMQAAALLKATPHPSDAEINAAMNGNLCRCMAYVRIKQAIKLAARTTAKPATKKEAHA